MSLRYSKVSYAILIILPGLIAFIYNAFIATPFYESQSLILIESNSKSIYDDMRLILFNSEALEWLDDSTNYTLNHKSKDIDYLNKASSDEFFRKHVQLIGAAQSNMLGLKVQSITPAHAVKINQSLLTFMKQKIGLTNDAYNMIVIIKPSFENDKVYPNTLKSTITVLGLSFSLFAILYLGLAVIREHAIIKL